MISPFWYTLRMCMRVCGLVGGWVGVSLGHSTTGNHFSRQSSFWLAGDQLLEKLCFLSPSLKVTFQKEELEMISLAKMKTFSGGGGRVLLSCGK